MYVTCSLAGELKDPSKSIPKGTLGAVLFTFTTYIIEIVLIGGSSERLVAILIFLEQLLLLREIWAKLKTGLPKTTEEVCGTTKPQRWRRETWWWNKEVDDAITAKHQAFKAWKAGKCTQASYNTAKRIARCVVHHAPTKLTRSSMRALTTSASNIFRLANQMRKENVDVVGDKPVKNDAEQGRGLNIMKGFSTLHLTGTLITCPTKCH